ncbi:hypothetical protein CORC01_08290, partial [Colletotrichum orchidophilum]
WEAVKVEDGEQDQRGFWGRVCLFLVFKTKQPRLTSNCGSDETWIQWATTRSLLQWQGSGRPAEQWVQAAPEASVVIFSALPLPTYLFTSRYG